MGIPGEPRRGGVWSPYQDYGRNSVASLPWSLIRKILVKIFQGGHNGHRKVFPAKTAGPPRRKMRKSRKERLIKTIEAAISFILRATSLDVDRIFGADITRI